MSITIKCPKCEQKLSAPDTAAGKQFRCKCGAMLRVKAEAAAEDAPPHPAGEESPPARAGGAGKPPYAAAIGGGVALVMAIAVAVAFMSRGGEGTVKAEKAPTAERSAAPGDVPKEPAAEPALLGDGGPEPVPQPLAGPSRKRKRARSEYLSPVALAADKEGTTLYVAEHTGEALAVFDVGEGSVKRTVPLPERPTGVALSPDGDKVYVTVGVSEGQVCVVALPKGKKVAKTMAVGHTPISPVVSPDGGTLYVCNRFDNDVSVVDLAGGTETARIKVTREPVAAAITPDGAFLFVVNHLPAGRADGDYAASVVSVIDTAAQKVATSIQLPNGSSGMRGICVSPDGKYAYATHILARYQLPTTQLERGWMNTNAMSIVDVATKKLVNCVLLDDVDLGAANPWDVTCTADGRNICVTHAGTHELSVIDAAKLHEKLAKVAKGEKVSDASSSAEDVPNDLSFLVGLRRRLRFKGNGPRGLALLKHESGTKAYATEYFTDSLGVIEIDPDKRPAPESIALGPEKEMSVVRKGEMVFHDAVICFQHWHSCSSCHPDGRSDGLNWDLLNDGLGNPKNAKSMLLAHKTPPAMITGIRPDAETAVRAGVKFILFAVRPEEEAQAIDEYLKALEPVPSPYLENGELSRTAKRGMKVFKKAGCAGCHPAPLYTDLGQHDIGVAGGREKGKDFDSPTLVEAWRTAPYLYDGRAADMKSVLKEHNKERMHGKTAKLGEAEIEALVEFVLSQ